MASFAPEVFIIESLTEIDEENKRQEGDMLSKILTLDLKKPIYKYVRSKIEFEKALQEYKKSRYRYLHISAHGSKDAIYMTNDDRISHDDLAGMLHNVIRHRRLFISSCFVVNSHLAKKLQSCHLFTLVGMDEKISFSKAALIWASLYHILFELDDKMSAKRIEKCLQDLSKLFDFKIKMFHYDHNDDYKLSKLL